MDLSTWIYLLAGLALLVAGAEVLIRGTTHLAAIFGISPLVVGLTVVAWATSSPELAVSVQAGITGHAGVGLGNVVGSNIFNILFILGACAVVRPLAVSAQLIRQDVPVMIGVSVLLLLFSLDGGITKVDGTVLLALLVAYTVFAIRQARRESPAIQQEYAAVFSGERRAHAGRIALQLLLIAAGFAMLVWGSRLLLKGAIDVARTLGLSDIVIGLTVVSVGTSLPEVAASVVATARGQRDIAIGNLVGSNIYNILLIAGTAAFAAPGGLPVEPAAMKFDLPVMVAVALVCLPIFFTGHRISRWEGLLLLGYYVAYISYLVLEAQGSPLRRVFGSALLYCVVPLSLLGLITMVWRARKASSPS